MKIKLRREHQLYLAKFPRLGKILQEFAGDVAKTILSEVTSPDAVDLATAITLVNEIKANINALASAPSGASLTSAAETFDLSQGSGQFNLQVRNDKGVHLFAFEDADFATPTAATAAEVVAALNQRLQALGKGLVVTEDAGKVVLTNVTEGSDVGLEVSAAPSDDANVALGFSTTEVFGTGFVPDVA